MLVMQENSIEPNLVFKKHLGVGNETQLKVHSPGKTTSISRDLMVTPNPNHH
jgi:hypothetical protein